MTPVRVILRLRAGVAALHRVGLALEGHELGAVALVLRVGSEGREDVLQVLPVCVYDLTVGRGQLRRAKQIV